ncbi:MAG: hypothetical protein AAF517_03045 [Planctomycetota bacterium]
MEYGGLVEKLLNNVGGDRALPVLLKILDDASFETRDHVPLWIALLGKEAEEALPVLSKIKNPNALKASASQAALWIRTLRDNPRFNGNSIPGLGWQKAQFKVSTIQMVRRG